MEKIGNCKLRNKARNSIKNYEVNVNFDLVYGNDFKILNQEKPKSVMLMEGSQITVENKKRI